jgi:hypothetical protein
MLAWKYFYPLFATLELPITSFSSIDFSLGKGVTLLRSSFYIFPFLAPNKVPKLFSIFIRFIAELEIDINHQCLDSHNYRTTFFALVQPVQSVI